MHLQKRQSSCVRSHTHGRKEAYRPVDELDDATEANDGERLIGFERSMRTPLPLPLCASRRQALSRQSAEQYAWSWSMKTVPFM